MGIKTISLIATLVGIYMTSVFGVVGLSVRFSSQQNQIMQARLFGSKSSNKVTIVEPRAQLGDLHSAHTRGCLERYHPLHVEKSGSGLTCSIA